MDILLLILGLTILLFSGNYLVNASVSLAGHLKIPRIVIGLILVSFGTSAPELVVSAKASYIGLPEIAIGNVIGSNIANIALVLALSAIFIPITVRRSIMLFDIPVMLVISLLLYVFMYDFVLSFIECLIFLFLLFGFIFYSFYRVKGNDKFLEEHKASYTILTTIILLVVSCIGLIMGADWLIDGVTLLATRYGVSERVIAISVVAIGTSLPELSTSVIAAIKKESDISVGNIVGSNIFNILGVLGVAGIIKPLPISSIIINFDYYWMLAFSLLLIIFLLPLKKSKIHRIKGIIFLALYFVYIYFLFYNK
jgi:cation:H+ antiporter